MNNPNSHTPQDPCQLPYFELQNVSRSYRIRSGPFERSRPFNALENIGLWFERGKAYGVVGESGSGKTTFARLLAGLIVPSSGDILFQGSPLAEVLKNRRREFRSKVQMIFQNPYSSLDPRWSVRKIIGEGIRDLPTAKRSERIRESNRQAGLRPELMNRRPAQLSGGERQRVAIARALAMEPEFLILDEPTASLDVTAQWEIIQLLKDLKPALKGGLLLVTHDLPLASQLCDRLFVFRSGKLIEQGPKKDVLLFPKSPYTKQLIDAIPLSPGQKPL